jgi:predicted PurR-regulated permease PerM
MLPRYFQGILIEMLILMGYLLVTLSLFGVPNSVLIAFVGALMNIVPYVGPLLGGFFGLFITVCSHIEADFYTVTFPLMGWVLGVFVTSQWFDNFLLQPIIFSKSVKAHPLEIFIVILIGAKLFGITGMIVAVPTYTMLRYIAAEFFSHIKFFNQLTGHLNEEEAEEEEENEEGEGDEAEEPATPPAQ